MNSFSRRFHCAYFLLCSWILLLGINYRLFFTEPNATSGLETLFFTLSYAGYFFWIACIATVLLALLLAIPMWQRLRTGITTLLIAFTIILSFAVSMVYSIWRMGINDKLLQFATAPGAGKVIEVSNTVIISLVAAIVILLAVSWLATRIIYRASKRDRHGFLKTCLALGGLLFIVSQGWSFISMRCNLANTSVLTQKLPQFKFLSPSSWINHIIPETRHQQVTEDIKHSLDLVKPIKQPALKGSLPQAPMDVLLIVVDTLRADMITPDIMPHSFAFATTADRFMNHDSGGNCTQPGIFTLFYGIPPTYWDSAISYPEAPPLIHRLQELNYSIDLLASAPLTVPNFQRALFSSLPDTPFTPGSNAMDRDTAITNQAIDVINRKNTARKHFTFVFLDTVHSFAGLEELNTPFSPERSMNYLLLSPNLNRTPIMNRYKNAAYFDDALIGRMLKALKEKHALDHTVVIITADHGQSFNDLNRNYWGHASNFDQFQLRVPMIIRWPNKQPETIHYRTSHYDIAPTLMKRVLGVTTDPHTWSVGHDLYNNKPHKWIIAQSYVNTALVSNNRIITMYSSGNHYVTNRVLARTKNQIPDSALNTFLTETRQFFDSTVTPKSSASIPAPSTVIPAKAGTQKTKKLDPRLREDDNSRGNNA